MRVRNRKSLFLATSILRGTQPRKDAGEGGEIEVGAGFAAAADKMSGDDNRDPEQRGGGATHEIDDNAADDADAGQNDTDSGSGDADGNSDDAGDDDEGGDQDDTKSGKRGTAEYIRELKRERRENRRMIAELKNAVDNLQNGGLTNSDNRISSSPTSAKPDANDATKYPLGVLDDGYITDMIEWTADQKVAEKFNGRDAAEKQRQDNAAAESRVAELRTHLDRMTDEGSDLFDDFEEKCLEPGLRGDWKLTETTFTAASEAKHGAEILYNLASDKTEAARVAGLSAFQQLKYVQEKDAEIAEKRKPRTRPGANPPPSNNAPAGRNSSSAIRPDTDNLDDFRKIFYRK